MQIALVTYSLRIGGLENVIFNLGKGFISKGFDVEIIETLEVGVWKKYFTENGFKVVSIVKRPFKSAIRHAEQLAEYLKKFDIILLNDSPVAQSSIGKLRSGTLVFPVIHLPLTSMAVNASGNKGQWNKIIAISPLLKDYLLNEIVLIKKNDIICIPNGIDTREFVSFKKKSIGRKKILFLGRLTEQKGIEFLPEIISRIKDHPLFDRLDVFGEGPMEKELKLTIERLNLQSKINIKGSINHNSVSKIIPEYDIFLMPSLMEGHPIALLEAMACGLVPVVSELPGSTDFVVDHENNGYLCEAGNVDQFVANVVLALENTNLEKMALKARSSIKERFSYEIMCNQYIELFKSLSNNTTARSGIIDRALLEDYPFLPYILKRPIRKLLKLFK
jgi:glycosyltransferase involved in cell wall biosynthesis